MKVVLFCGGLGMRMRDYSQTQPKPMAVLRNRPLLWHVMRWYAHWGHKDFILCLGHRGEAIKEYFLGYNEAMSNDFVLSDGGHRVELLAEDIRDWRITFVDTGLTSNIGERLRRVAPFLDGDETFLANYSDGLSARRWPPSWRCGPASPSTSPACTMTARWRVSWTSRRPTCGSMAVSSSWTAACSTTWRKVRNWCLSRSSA